MFERLMFKKLEVWVVGLIVVAGLVVSVLFGAVVRATALGSDRYGLIGQIALQVALLPNQTRRVIGVLRYGEKHDLASLEQRFEGISGFVAGNPATLPSEAEYLLLSRYDGDRRRSVIELVDMKTQTIRHVWLPDFAEINSRTQLTSKLTDIHRDNSPERARVIHPLLTDAGEIVFQNTAPLVKIDACSKTVWTIDRLFHHGNEMSADGNYWVALHLEPQTIGGVSDTFIEDAISLVSPDGRILYEKSVPELLIENGYGHLVYGLDFYSDDPLHLNDIQEAPFDGPHWRKGDVFLSLRNVSAIVLYRPSENRVVWLKQWPWVNQHDVDILDDHRISVFSNNTFRKHRFEYVEGSNEVHVHDLSTGKTSSPYKEAMQRHEVRTLSMGLSEILPDGHVFVEESNYGRLLLLEPQGDIVWSYVNRAADGQVYVMNWSRVLSREAGDRVVSTLASKSCLEL